MISKNFTMKEPKKKPNYFIKSLIKTYTDFAEHTSIHGLKYTIQKDFNVIERFFWIAVVIFGILGSAFMLQLFWERYTSNPTRTSIETIYASTIEIPFPAITICNINRLMPSKVEAFVKKLDLNGYDEEYIRNIFPQLLAYIITKSYNKTELEILHKILNLNEYKNIQNTMAGITQNCDEMLVKCKWEAKTIDCKKYFIDTLTPRGVCCSFNFNPTSNYFNTTSFFGFQMGLTVFLDPMIEAEHFSSLHSNGMIVVIHNPRNYPGFGNTEKILATGRETLLQLEGTRYICGDGVRKLEPNQRGCVFEDEYKLKYFPKYTEENCLIECRASFIQKHCGCTPYFYQFSDKHICNITKIPCLAELRQSTQGYADVDCDCPMQCEDIFYEILSTSTEFVQTQYLTSSFLSDLNITRESLLMHTFFSSQTQTILRRDTVTSTIYLLSSFGGIFSLFLGCSFISGIEIIYYATIRFCINFQQAKKVVVKPCIGRQPFQTQNNTSYIHHGYYESDYYAAYEQLFLYPQKCGHEPFWSAQFLSSKPEAIWLCKGYDDFRHKIEDGAMLKGPSLWALDLK